MMFNCSHPVMSVHLFTEILKCRECSADEESLEDRIDFQEEGEKRVRLPHPRHSEASEAIHDVTTERQQSKRETDSELE